MVKSKFQVFLVPNNRAFRIPLKDVTFPWTVPSYVYSSTIDVWLKMKEFSEIPSYN